MNERWLITGASGQLGGHVVRLLSTLTLDARIAAVPGRGDVVGGADIAVHRVDLADFDALRRCVQSVRPTHVVHLGAMTSVADACARPQEAERVNTHATGVLAAAAADCGARFVFSSTDMVFSGQSAPYRETDTPAPLSHYGRTKLAAERLVTGFENALVVRLPLMYGFPCTPRRTTFVQQVEALRGGERLKLFVDEYRTPVWLVDAAAAAIELARSDLTGIIHVAGPQRLSRYEMVARWAELLGMQTANLEPVSRLAIESPEPRPADLSLDGSRFARLFPHCVPGPIRRTLFQSDVPQLGC